MTLPEAARLERSMADYGAMLRRQHRMLRDHLEACGYSSEERGRFLSVKLGVMPKWATEKQLESWLETELERWAKEEG